MAFAQPTVEGANSMCRAGSRLQLFQSVLWSANTSLVVVHSSLIGFFPTVLGLVRVFKIVLYCVCFFYPAQLHSLSFCTAGCWDILLLPIPLLCLAPPGNFVTRKARRLASFQHLVAGDPVLQ